MKGVNLEACSVAVLRLLHDCDSFGQILPSLGVCCLMLAKAP